MDATKNVATYRHIVTYQELMALTTMLRYIIIDGQCIDQSLKNITVKSTCSLGKRP